MSNRPATKPIVADVLSDVLETLHLTNLIQGLFELSAPWGLDLGNDDVATSIVVVSRGSAWVSDGKSDRELSAGDLLLHTRAGRLLLRDSATSRAALTRRSDGCTHLGVDLVRLGGGGRPASLIAAGFRFRPTWGLWLLRQLPPLVVFPANAHDAPPGLTASVSLFVAEATSPRDGSSAILGRLAEVLLVQALRTGARRRDCSGGDLRALADPQLSDAMRLMHASPAADWTVESLGRKVGLSRSSFAARFNAVVGRPPLEYLAHWRMTRAAQLLVDTQDSLAHVAGAVGYTSEAAFSRAFTRVMGRPPGAFRRAERAA